MYDFHFHMFFSSTSLIRLNLILHDPPPSPLVFPLLPCNSIPSSFLFPLLHSNPLPLFTMGIRIPPAYQPVVRHTSVFNMFCLQPRLRSINTEASNMPLSPPVSANQSSSLPFALLQMRPTAGTSHSLYVSRFG